MDTTIKRTKRVEIPKTFTAKKVLWGEQNIDNIVIPEEHRLVVRERIKKYINCSDSYLSWNDIERKMSNRG